MTIEQTGRVVGGRYRLVSRLAAGGMGVTYRAWDLRRGCPVVLKMPRQPHDDFTREDFAKIAARFLREIETMRTLAHDHIVPIVSHGDDLGTPFVAMRFLPGGALSEDRKPSPAGEWQPMPAGALHFWLPSIASALDFIHSQGVVHRDVKPANIFFDGFRNAFLGDFGIAKVFSEDANPEKGKTLTATHLAIGTPEYMAPELLSPKVNPDGRADQYALAVSVYELLAGRRPFTGSTAHILVEHATLPPPLLDARALAVPESLAAAVKRALAKKPSERFGSCREFAEAALFNVTAEPNDLTVARLICPGCRKVLKVPRSAGGRQGNCPACKQSVEIAADFSALWLQSEAALLVDAPAGTESTQVLGLTNSTDDANSSSLESDNTGLSHADKRWPSFGPVAAVIAASVLAAFLAGLCTHWLWYRHHQQVVETAAAQRSREQQFHATAIADATAAIALSEKEWGQRLRDMQTELEDSLSTAEAARAAMKQELTTTKQAQQNQSDAIDKEQKRLAAETAAAAKLRNLQAPLRELTNSIGIKMLLITPGTYALRKSFGLSYEATLTKPFFIGVTELTNEQWKAVMGTDVSRWKENGRPVESVSWHDAVDYCKRLSAIPTEVAAGHLYRLPTEVEWEIACRAGTLTKWAHGDDEESLMEHAWLRTNSSIRTHTVGSKEPNAWGLFDMHGNVWEWCADWYGRDPGNGGTDPKGPLAGTERIYRGGSWENVPASCMSAHRAKDKPTERNIRLGFRVAMSPSEIQPPDAAKQKPDGAGVSEDGGADKPREEQAGVPAVQPEARLDPPLVNSIGMKLQRIPAGQFKRDIGRSTVQERPADQIDVHITTPFYIGIHEVTNAQWKTVMRNEPAKNAGDDHPVANVNWTAVVTFCNRLSGLPEERLAGRAYRLPTEAEWEYACRAGTTTEWSSGDEEKSLAECAWFRDRHQQYGEKSRPVGTLKPNPWGLYDMHGNVREWCSDCSEPFAAVPAARAVWNPVGPASGRARINRGGSFATYASRAGSSHSDAEDHLRTSEDLGFRIAFTEIRADAK